MTSTPKAPWIGLMLMVLLGGCAGTAFTEADLGRMKEVELGSSFTIALPRYGDWKDPRLNTNVAKFLDHHVDESAEQDVFAFRAEREGVTDILISAGSPDEQDRNFSIRVRVVDEADAVDADPWGDRWDWTRSRHRDRD